MDVRDFDFDLPPELIAQEPPPDRGAARLLHPDRRRGALTHTHITALPALLQPGDLVVVNNTRVFPARLIGRRVPSGGAVECLLVARLRSSGARYVPDTCLAPDDEPASPMSDAGSTDLWEALVHPGQKLKPGAR